MFSFRTELGLVREGMVHRHAYVNRVVLTVDPHTRPDSLSQVDLDAVYELRIKQGKSSRHRSRGFDMLGRCHNVHSLVIMDSRSYDDAGAIGDSQLSLATRNPNELHTLDRAAPWNLFFSEHGMRAHKSLVEDCYRIVAQTLQREVLSLESLRHDLQCSVRTGSPDAIQALDADAKWNLLFCELGARVPQPLLRKCYRFVVGMLQEAGLTLESLRRDAGLSHSSREEVA